MRSNGGRQRGGSGRGEMDARLKQQRQRCDAEEREQERKLQEKGMCDWLGRTKSERGG